MVISNILHVHPQCCGRLPASTTALSPHLSQLFFTVEIFRAATESRVACFQHGKMTDDMNMRNFGSSSGYEIPSKSRNRDRNHDILVGETQDPWSLACFFTPFYALPGIPIWTSEIFSESPISKPEGWSDEHHTFFMGPEGVFFLLKDWGYFSKVTNFQFCGVILPICPR